MTSFGEELKRERELRDISLKEISEATKISIRFLEALEQNNFDILPGGIFNRGFIRSYARFIGVDGEEMVNAYLHEISLKESGKTQGAPAGMAAAAESSGVFRPETRRTPAEEPRAERRIPKERPSRVIITPESKFPIGSSHEATGGRASMAIWVLVVLAVFAGGAGLLTMRLSGNRLQEESSTGSHVQAIKARMNKTPPAAAAISSTPTGPTEQVPGDPGTDKPVGAPDTTTDDPGKQPENPDSVQPAPPVAASTPPPVVHQILLRINETTSLTLECGGHVSLSHELWAGSSKRLTCAEPVVLSADNGGAVEISIDGGPAGLLGAMGERIEPRILAPIPAPSQPDTKSAGVAGGTHVGD